MSDGMRREFTYLSSHATNRYFIPNWGNVGARVLGWCSRDCCTPWEGGVGMAGCHTLLRKIPRIARMCTD